MLKLFLTGGVVSEEGSQVYIYVSQHQKKARSTFITQALEFLHFRIKSEIHSVMSKSLGPHGL